MVERPADDTVLSAEPAIVDAVVLAQPVPATALHDPEYSDPSDGAFHMYAYSGVGPVVRPLSRDRYWSGLRLIGKSASMPAAASAMAKCAASAQRPRRRPGLPPHPAPVNRPVPTSNQYGVAGTAPYGHFDGPPVVVIPEYRVPGGGIICQVRRRHRAGQPPPAMASRSESPPDHILRVRLCRYRRRSGHVWPRPRRGCPPRRWIRYPL